MEKLRDEAKEEGRTEGRLETLFDLVRDRIITLTEDSKRANMTETVFRKI
jgi:hypothetical protein